MQSKKYSKKLEITENILVLIHSNHIYALENIPDNKLISNIKNEVHILSNISLNDTFNDYLKNGIEPYDVKLVNDEDIIVTSFTIYKDKIEHIYTNKGRLIIYDI